MLKWILKKKTVSTYNCINCNYKEIFGEGDKICRNVSDTKAKFRI